MEIFRFNILPLADLERREAYKTAMNCCPICATQIRFEYERDYLQNLVKEDGHCPECNIKVKEDFFSVQ